MSLPRGSTRRPVAVAMLYLSVVLLGLISYFRLPIDLLPDVSYPRLVVYTSYPDVAPAEVERLVTERIEGQAAAVPGVFAQDGIDAAQYRHRARREIGQVADRRGHDVERGPLD